MKYVTIIFLLVALILIGGGIYYDLMGMDEMIKDKLYGFGSICLFFLAMPSFLFYRRNKTDMKKYMLNLDRKDKIEDNPNEN